MLYEVITLLQNYGEGDDPRMEFGLITGSYTKNMSGGVLRAQIGKLKNEIANNGTFQTRGSSNTGVIEALNLLEISNNFSFKAFTERFYNKRNNFV